MKHQEINKIDAVRDLLFGAEMSSIQDQFKDLTHKLESEQSKTQKTIETNVNEKISALDEKMDLILSKISAVEKKADALSKSTVDRKRLQALFGDFAKKM